MQFLSKNTPLNHPATAACRNNGTVLGITVFLMWFLANFTRPTTPVVRASSIAAGMTERRLATGCRSGRKSYKVAVHPQKPRCPLSRLITDVQWFGKCPNSLEPDCSRIFIHVKLAKTSFVGLIDTRGRSLLDHNRSVINLAGLTPLKSPGSSRYSPQ